MTVAPLVWSEEMGPVSLVAGCIGPFPGVAGEAMKQQDGDPASPVVEHG